MKITNNFNVPDAIIRAAYNDTYTKGESDRSVTQLIGSPRIDLLRKKHYAEMQKDVTEEIWSLLGRGVHNILEQNPVPNEIREERLYAKVNGWVISGAIDVQIHKKTHINILDYKVTSVFSVTAEEDGKREWIEQQNFYAWLVRMNKKLPVRKLQICAILRDWAKREAIIKPDYPQAPIIMIDLPVWSDEEQEQFVRERVYGHQRASFIASTNAAYPQCSPHDKWQSDARFAVFRQGNKRASRVFDSREEADHFAEGSSGTVHFRPGKPRRCLGNYCGVARWCSQHQQDKAQFGKEWGIEDNDEIT